MTLLIVAIPAFVCGFALGAAIAYRHGLHDRGGAIRPLFPVPPPPVGPPRPRCPIDREPAATPAPPPRRRDLNANPNPAPPGPPPAVQTRPVIRDHTPDLHLCRICGEPRSCDYVAAVGWLCADCRSAREKSLRAVQQSRSPA